MKPRRAPFPALLALWPTLPVLFPAAQLWRLPGIRELPRLLLWSWLAYALLGSVAALGTPQPLLSLGLLWLKAAWMGGLMVLGWRLALARQLWPLSAGLVVVYVTALLTPLLSGNDYRLTHPFFMPTSLGLAAGTGVLMALLLPHRWLWWRVLFGLGSAAVLLGAASRAVAAALVLGILAALLMGKTRAWWAALFGGGAVVGAWALNLLPQNAVRLLNFSGLSRDEVWYSALALIAQRPWFGYGPYQAGALLQPPEKCDLFYAMSFLNIFDGVCPSWVVALGNPWVVAHNEGLQALLEGGLVGTVGFLVFLGAGLLILLSSRDRFLVAVAVMAILVSVVDNPLSFPSPYFAEFFLVTVGVAAAQRAVLPAEQAAGRTFQSSLFAPLAASVLLLLPLWLTALGPARQGVGVLSRLSSNHFVPGEPYPVYSEWMSGQAGALALLRVCAPACTVVARKVLPASGAFWLDWRPAVDLNLKAVRMELVVLDGTDGWTSHVPLARAIWSVPRE